MWLKDLRQYFGAVGFIFVDSHSEYADFLNRPLSTCGSSGSSRRRSCSQLKDPGKLCKVE